MSFSPLIQHLILALRCLPGVGPKSAQRMAFHLLERHRDKGVALARILEEAMKVVRHCEHCRTFCEEAVCALCQNKGRDGSLLCVVETPADILAIEQAGTYRGLYFVLMGHLSPIDAVGPEEIGVALFIKRLEMGEVKEVILATNPTVEGEATAYYFAELARAKGIRATRIALGVPMGGELEYLDSNTLSRALSARSLLTDKVEV